MRLLSRATLAALLIICPSLVLDAQEETPRMKFNNIEITGGIEEFASQLSQDGYTLVETTELGKMFRGSYLGYPGCSVYAITTPVTQTVCKMSVYLPARNRWSDLMNDYRTAKEFFVKTASRHDCYEYFVGGYRSGDGREFIAVSEDCASQQTFCDFPEGTVSVFVYSIDRTSAQVKILFEPAAGIALLQKEKDMLP